MAKQYPLKAATPHSYTYSVRNLPEATVEQRERALNATHWNEFAFPAGMLTVDMLSDSGTTAMTDLQWSALMLGDEAYGRNNGYYCLLDAFRDIFERGGEKNWKNAIDLIRTGCKDVDKLMDELYLCEYEGGLFNGGAAQMERPNAFIIQQGRAAESVLMEIVKKILAERYPGKVFPIPSNGHFDTTEGNIKQMGSIPRNLYNKELLYEVPEGGKYEKNPFKGNMDLEKLEQLIKEFNLGHVRKNLGDRLSGGERRRTEIARCLAIEPKFVMLDEPFAGVDPIAVQEIQDVVWKLKDKNIGILITDHNVDETLMITDRAYLLFEGKILFHGTPEELAANPVVRKNYLGRDFELKKKVRVEE